MTVEEADRKIIKDVIDWICLERNYRTLKGTPFLVEETGSRGGLQRLYAIRCRLGRRYVGQDLAVPIREIAVAYRLGTLEMIGQNAAQRFLHALKGYELVEIWQAFDPNARYEAMIFNHRSHVAEIGRRGCPVCRSLIPKEDTYLDRIEGTVVEAGETCNTCHLYDYTFNYGHSREVIGFVTIDRHSDAAREVFDETQRIRTAALVETRMLYEDPGYQAFFLKYAEKADYGVIEIMADAIEENGDGNKYFLNFQAIRAAQK